jgi:Fe-S-cluster containining protein
MTACELCGGACCKSFALSKSILSGDASRWLSLHGKDESTHIRFEIQCKALKDNRCSIYSERPGVCKSYPVGNEKCIEAIKLYAPDKLEQIKELL